MSVESGGDMTPLAGRREGEAVIEGSLGRAGHPGREGGASGERKGRVKGWDIGGCIYPGVNGWASLVSMAAATRGARRGLESHRDVVRGAVIEDRDVTARGQGNREGIGVMAELVDGMHGTCGI